MASRIRVRLSGLILFMSNLLSFLFGFIFIVLISRNLSQSDLGLWFYIGSIITYLEFLVKALPFWATRDFARGRLIAKTTIISSTIISIPLTLIFLSLSGILSTASQAPIYPFLVASLLIPIYYASSSINSIMYVKYPQKVGWRVPLIDGLKIPIALYLLPYGLTGVLIAVIIANFVYVIYGIYVIRRDLEKSFDKDWLKSRVKHSWLPMIQSAIGYVNSASDQFLVGTLLSPLQLSTYGVGVTISNAIRTSSQLSLPFTMNVLSRTSTSKEEVSSITKFVTIFVIPMLIGGIILSRELLGIFGPMYKESAWILLPLLSFAALTSYSAIFYGIISGSEKIDYNLEVDFKTLLKSKLFKLTLIDYGTTAVLIISSMMIIPWLGAFGAALSRLIAASISFTILSIMCVQYLKFTKILKDIVLTTIACIPMTVYLILFKPSGAILALLTISIATIIYFVSLYLLDKESRKLIRTLVQEITQKLFYLSD
jgi:O-antigen/teichoic acid export membrane protein